MSQKIPFLLVLTLAASFAGLPDKSMPQNGPNLNAQQTNPNIEYLGSILKTMFETYENEKENKEKMKQENPNFLDMQGIFSIKDLWIMAREDWIELRGMIGGFHEHKTTLIKMILSSLFNLINEKYPQGKIKDSFEIFYKNSTEIKKKQYFELKNIPEEIKEKQYSELENILKEIKEKQNILKEIKEKQYSELENILKKIKEKQYSELENILKKIKEKQHFELKNIPKEIKEKQYSELENIDIENEKDNQFLIKNKENLAVYSSLLGLELDNFSHLLSDIIKIVQSEENNSDNQLNCLEKKFKECNDLENEANLHKELAIEKLKKENEILPNLYILNTHNKIFNEYLNKTIVAQNSICDLKFNALKETIMTLLPCLLKQQDILKIEEILSQN